MKAFSIGVLLGLGAAVPIGPVNIEMIKRNLETGTINGLVLGLGACSVDVLYLVLFVSGMMYLLNQPMILGWLGILGALLMAYFGMQSLKASTSWSLAPQSVAKSKFRHYIDGFVLTFLNPYTIIFWASMSTQLSMFDLESSKRAYIWLGTGLIVGAISWVLLLNGGLHTTRSKVTQKIQIRLNQMGAFILFSLAILGLYKGVNLIGWV